MEDKLRLAEFYAQSLCYIATEFFAAQGNPSREELVRYYRYGKIGVRIVEDILDEKIDFDPIGSLGLKNPDSAMEVIHSDMAADDFDDDEFEDTMVEAFRRVISEESDDVGDSPDESDDFDTDIDMEDLEEDQMSDNTDDESSLKTTDPADRDLSRKPIDHSLFREYYHKYLLVYQNPASCGLDKLGFGINPGDNCMLAYGYVDHTAGLSLHILCSACETKQGLLKLGSVSNGSTMTMRYNSENGNIQSLGSLIPNEAFFNKIRMVNEGYKGNADLEILREYEDIDLLRHPKFPDDMRVKFIKPGLQGEEIWCRMESISDNLIMGTLLNEPYGDFGIHEGDSVGILTGLADGEMVAIAKL